LRAWDQFRQPALATEGPAAYGLGIVAFLGLSLNLFMIFSRGYSPQFVLWYLPFLVLAMPNGWGLAYATLLTVNSVVERILFFFVLPDSEWLLAGTVLFRTALMLVLVPEYLAVMDLLPSSLWRKARRWIAASAALVTVLALAWGTRAFVRDYTELRYSESTQKQAVDRIRASALSSDGVVVTSREAFDSIAPFLPQQEVRLYTRDDGEFRPEVFREQWIGYVTRHPRIWLLQDYAGGQNADWNAYLADYLRQDGHETSDEWVGQEQRLLLYALSRPDGERLEELDAVFGGSVRLLSVSLGEEPLRGGDALRLTLRWQAMEEDGAEPKVFLHLLSAEEQILAQRDVNLDHGGGDQRVGLLLPVDLAPGAYQLLIGVYDPATGERLTLPTGEDSLAIEGIRVR
jgi:hypothetical protein